MCGLAGFFSFNFQYSRTTLNQMGLELENRGPDGEGTFIKETLNYRAGFIHKRLAIIDLSETGSQPMHSENCTIVFNGEIYNYLEIKKLLISEGVKFQTQSDTEVILKAYENWGIDKCILHLKGMFAFCLTDWSKQIFYLVRDRAGVKPLFYTQTNENFLFASTLKGLTPFKSGFSLHKNAFSHYLQTGYVPGNSSIFNEVQKIQPGCYLSYDLIGNKKNIIKYWSVYDSLNTSQKLNYKNEDYVELIEEKLISAFKYRTISDVPIGLFLSGGYDSTAILALLNKHYSGTIKTFTIGFNEKLFDESIYAKNIANYLNVEHHELICSVDEAQKFIPQIPIAYDEPFGDSSAIPTMMLSQFARQHVKVALSGDGGDELFAGYYKHSEGLNNIKKLNKFYLKSSISNLLLANLAKKISKLSINSHVAKKLNKLAYILNNKLDFHEIQALANITTTSDILSSILKYDSFKYGSYHRFDEFNTKAGDLLNYILAYDFSTYMVDDVLVKVDRATMHMSLEGREPFLDHELIETIFSIPSQYKVINGQKKAMLKSVVHKYVPKEYLDRPKKGFSLPLKHWMRTSLKDYFLDTLSESSIISEEFLNTKEVIKIRDKYFDGQMDNFETLWYIHCYLQWKVKF